MAAEGELVPQDIARKEHAFVILLCNRLEELHHAVVENDSTRDARCRELNASCRIVDVEQGDYVFLWKPPLGREGRKLADPWVGPFEVKGADEHLAWLKTHDGKEVCMHRRRLKKAERVLLSNDTLRTTSLGNADGDIVEVSGMKARRKGSDGAECLAAWKGARKKDWMGESSSALLPALVRAFNRGSLHRGTALRSTLGESFL
ncbi:hypothetical protein FVE85_4623 [Porphyridium purpureum]|uniref:Chromo domain-containing protein n=1 Tax=Porphyridium purpureum TaxID=35688 RepID=A0A5J4YQC8_PORPP|nr:hypothetical protein FVE85_4623 [Porphyridium purpureum]|eukprot:POR6689..scf236_6